MTVSILHQPREEQLFADKEFPDVTKDYRRESGRRKKSSGMSAGDNTEPWTMNESLVDFRRPVKFVNSQTNLP